MERNTSAASARATRGIFEQGVLVHDLFDAQAGRTPQAEAVVCESQSLTFAELNEQATALADLLREQGVRPDVLVGMFLERSVAIAVALLGILRSGGAYVPLDPQYPFERLRYILDDATPRVVLTQRGLEKALPPSTAKVISIDGEWCKNAADRDLSATASASAQHHADQLAYVIYTSGSTGWPKGVMVEHRHVVSLWRGLERLYGECPSCLRVGLNASINFDASVQQLMQLLSGRTLVVVPAEARRDPERLLRVIEEQRIGAIDCTPSQLKSWIQSGLLRSERCPLQMVLVGGEPIDPDLWVVLAQCRHIRFFNVYGPTECTVDVTSASLSGDTSTPHIGRPMPGRQVYVLGEHREPLPVGARGEIYVGGLGIARGYLNRPEMTAESFLRDPFIADPEARMYRTGDLGRWRADGLLAYDGREDFQVKIRGYRIELGEIESQLLRHEQVRHAIVMARDDLTGEMRLVAYVVPFEAEDSNAFVDALRDHLIKHLPEYMVPAAFVVLDELPLNPAGKLNREALPVPPRRNHSASSYDEPQGEVEETLAGIWQSVLGLDRVGRNDNFFQLGGDSLLFVQMLNDVRRAGLPAEARQVFETRALKDMASALAESRTRAAIPPRTVGMG